MKAYLQCGYEDQCKNKECLRCPRKNKYTMVLTLAEETAIEDFATCDMEQMIKEKPAEFNLTQNVMLKLMNKIFNKQ